MNCPHHHRIFAAEVLVHEFSGGGERSAVCHAGSKCLILAGLGTPEYSSKNFLHRRAGCLLWPASEASFPDDSPERSSFGHSETMGRERHAESGLNRSGDRLFELPSQERFVPRCHQRRATGVYPDLRCLISQRSTLNPQQNAAAQWLARNLKSGMSNLKSSGAGCRHSRRIQTITRQGDEMMAASKTF